MKNKAYGILGIAFVVFNIIAFIVPTPKTSTFWIIYIFTIIAFIAQVFIWKVAFENAITLKSKFIGFPIINIGIVFLVFQLIIFVIFLIFPFAPVWISITICILLLSISSIFLIATEVGRDEIVLIDEKVHEKVFYIKELQVEVELLADDCVENDSKGALLSLAEKIRYSDPMSNESLLNLESQIKRRINHLKECKKEYILTEINEIEKLLTERNKKCKILK